MANTLRADQDTVPMAGQELTIVRVFDAPRDILWQCWTEPERLMQWWGPRDHIMTIAALELRPGGVFHYCLRSPMGQETWGLFTYMSISEPEKLVFLNSYANITGAVARHPAIDTWPLEVFTIFQFTEAGSKTIFSMKSRPHNATAAEHLTYLDNRQNIKTGTAVTFEQLDRYLATVYK